MSRHLQRILEASGQKVPAQKPVLKVNLGHGVLARAERESDAGRFREWALLLLDQAVLSEGGQLADPAGFVRRMNGLLVDTISG